MDSQHDARRGTVEMKQQEFQFMAHNHKIIALTGKKKSGKNHAAWLASLDHPDIVQMAFATPLKKMTSDALQVPLDQIETDKKDFRSLLQNVGEVLRGHHKNIFVDHLESQLPVTDEPRTILITDCRRKNEAEWIRAQGGIVVRIDRIKPRSSDPEPVDDHISETEMDEIEPDLVLINDWKSPELFRNQMSAVVECVKQGRSIQIPTSLDVLAS